MMTQMIGFLTPMWEAQIKFLALDLGQHSSGFSSIQGVNQPIGGLTKKQKITKVGQDMERLDPSNISGRNV